MGGDDGGVIITGTKGKIMCECYGANPTLLPTSKTKEINVPQTLARVPEGHYVTMGKCLHFPVMAMQKPVLHLTMQGRLQNYIDG